MRLIDADDFIRFEKEVFDLNTINDITAETVFKQIMTDAGNQQTVDAIPIVWMQWWSDCTENGGIWNDTGHQVIHTLIEDWRKERMDELIKELVKICTEYESRLLEVEKQILETWELEDEENNL